MCWLGYLVLQLKCFVSHHGNFIKHIKKVLCTETVPVVVDEVFFLKRFNLIASVNYTRTLDRGHYIAFVKQSNYLCWHFCNDTAALRSSLEKVNNTSSYIYTYKAF